MCASDFTRACIAVAACVIVGTPLLLLCGGRLAAARALGLDDSEVDELPERAEHLFAYAGRKQALIDELRRQMDMWQARYLEASRE